MIQNCTNLKKNVSVCIVGFKYLELSGVDKNMMIENYAKSVFIP